MSEDGRLDQSEWPKWRRWSFRVLAAAYAVVLVLPPNSLLPFVVLAWALGDTGGGTSHRVHEIAFGVVFLLAFVGLLAQFRKTGKKVLPMQQVLVPILVLIIVETLVSGFQPEFAPLYLMFGAPPIVLAILHPSRREVFRPSVRPSRFLMVLAAVLAIPSLIFAVQQITIGNQAQDLGRPVFERLDQLPEDSTEDDFERAFSEIVTDLGLSEDDQVLIEHGGHWTAMAGWSIGLVILAGLVAVRVPGFRLSGWSVGLAVAYYGIVSIASPDDASSGGVGVGIAAVVWGLVFVVFTQIESRSMKRLPEAEPAPAPSGS